MQLISLELVNFCQHVNRVVQFTQGLNAIVGPNGSGKSNVFNAICFALTGDIPISGSKADNISQSASKKSKSSVSLVFEHGGITYTVRRNIRPSKPVAVLLAGDIEVASGDSGVDEAIEKILGAPLKLVRSMSIVDHAGLFGFLDASPGERREQFARLFNVDRAKKIYGDVEKFLRTRVRTAMTRTSADIEVQLLESRSAVSQLLSRISSLNCDAATVQREIDNVNTKLSNLRLRIAAEDSLSAASGAELAVKSAVTEAEREIATHRAVVAAVDIDSSRSRQEYLQNLVRQWVVFDEASRNYGLLLEQIAAIDVVIAEIDSRLADISVSQHNDAQIAEFRNEHSNLYVARQQWITLAAKRDLPEVCPTCGSLTQDTAKQAAFAQSKLDETFDKFNWLSQVLNSYESSQLMIKDLEQQRLAKLETRRQLLTAAGSPPSQPDSSRGDVALELDRVSAVIADYESRVVKIGMIDNQIRTSGSLLASSADAVKAASARLSAVPVVAESAEELQDELRSWSSVLTIINDLSTRKAVAEDRVLQLSGQLEEAIKQERRIEKMSKFVTLAEAAGSLFHDTAATLRVLTSNLQLLEQAINVQLSLFSADFTVTAGDDANFTASFVNGTMQPVQRLSQGQKVSLAFAFRLAIVSTFMPMLNCLCFDEPTAFLDARRIAAFDTVFAALKRMSEQRGLQCIVVTHERSLDRLFGNLIELG